MSELETLVALVLAAVALAALARRVISRLFGTWGRIRVPSYAVWDTVVFVLNVLAFTGGETGVSASNHHGRCCGHRFAAA